MPFAGDTHELQTGNSPSRAWFLQMAGQHNTRIKSGQTSQGFYVASPGGTSYGYNNNRSIERVIGMMDKALDAAKTAPPTAAGDGPPAEAELAPIGVSVARVFTRIRPVPVGSDPANNNVARDHLWIYPSDVLALAQLPPSGGKLPEALARRLARFHFVDNVRGEPNMWSDSEVAKLDLRVVQDPEHKGKLRAFKIQGSFLTASTKDAHGMEGTVDGWISIDEVSTRVTQLYVVVDALAWGSGSYTKNPPPGRFPVVIGIQIVGDAMSRRVPPQGYLWGDAYRTGRG